VGAVYHFENEINSFGPTLRKKISKGLQAILEKYLTLENTRNLSQSDLESFSMYCTGKPIF